MISPLQEALRLHKIEVESYRTQDEARIVELLSMYPEIASLHERIRQNALTLPRLCFERPDTADEMVQQIREENAQIRELISKHLAKAGLPTNALERTYLCAICHDSGRKGELIQERCSCVQSRIAKLLMDRSGLPQQGGSFERCQLDIFPHGGDHGQSQREKMSYFWDIGREYAEHFPNVQKPNLFITGESGLGKSFLAEAIARRVLQRGYPALIITAWKLLECMRAYHMGAISDTSMDTLFDIPLLLLDDLGSEPLMENLSIPHLFTLLNQRKIEGKATAIITNLLPSDFGARYTERVLSRALDTNSTLLLAFKGVDVRLARRI